MNASPPPAGVIVNHTYTADGAYSVTLVVVDDKGATSTAYSVTIQVGERKVATPEIPLTYYIGGGVAAGLVVLGIGLFLRRRKARLKAAEPLPG